MIGTTTFSNAFWFQIEVLCLPSTVRAAIPPIVSVMSSHDNGKLTDEQLRHAGRLGPKRMAQFADAMIEAGFMIRAETGNLALAGMLAAPQSEESHEISERTLTRRLSLMEARLKEEILRHLGAIAHPPAAPKTGQNDGQTAPENRTNEVEKSAKTPYENGHPDPDPTQSVQNPPDSGDSSTRLDSSLVLEEHICSTSLDSSSSLDPARASKKIFAELLEIGLTPKQAEQAFRDKTPDFIAIGLEHLAMGLWKKSTNPVTSMLNYIAGKLPLDKHFWELRAQTAATMLSAVPGGTAQAPSQAAANEDDNRTARKTAFAAAKRNTAPLHREA